MSWWRKVLGLTSQPDDVESSPLVPSEPALILLMSDAAGLAALRTISFEDAGAAAEYIELWYPQRSGGAAYPFWALAGEPVEDWRSAKGDRGESIVLISDEVREDVVYPFSFSDMETALMFVREEIGNGVDFHRIRLHWAIPIEVSISESGQAQLSPDSPPPLSRRIVIPESPEPSIDTKTTFVPKVYVEAMTDEEDEAPSQFEKWVPRFPVSSPRVEALELSEASVGEVDEPHDIAPVTPERANGTAMPIEENGTMNGSTNGTPVEDDTDVRGDNEDVTSEPDDEDDVLGNMRRILRWRRLEHHDGPFTGFDSPPGRF